MIRLPGGGETSFLTEDEDIFLGRVQSINDICINDPSVSRQHAHIKKREEGYAIYDLKSLNGVILNGKRVSRALLRHGDEIRLGEVVIRVDMKDHTPEEVLRVIEESEKTHAEKRDPCGGEITRPVSPRSGSRKHPKTKR